MGTWNIGVGSALVGVGAVAYSAGYGGLALGAVTWGVCAFLLEIVHELRLIRRRLAGDSTTDPV